MRQNTRDLAHAGLYLLSLALLLVGGYYSAAYAIKNKHGSTFLVATASSVLPDTPETTRLSVNVQTAREVRAALERPMPGPAKLQPITAKVAFGYLRPGGKGERAVAAQKPKRPSIPREALDAMAMQPPEAARHAFGNNQHTYVQPEKHKVY